MSRADDIKRGIEALARELGEIEKFGPDVFEDETVLVIKKTFDAPRVVRVRPGVTGHKAYCHVYDATGDLDSDMSFEEILGRLCNCGADQVTTEELSPKEFTFAILKAGGRWWITGKYQAGRTWAELVDWLKKGKITEAWVATDYESIPEWVQP